MLHPNLESQDQKTLEALEFYCSHTAQIEVVRHDRSLGKPHTDRSLGKPLTDRSLGKPHTDMSLGKLHTDRA